MAQTDQTYSIATQVAAKIAADMVDKGQGVDERISEFAVLFETVRLILFDAIFGTDAQPTPLALVTNAFPGSTEEPPSASSGPLSVKGAQHGPLPAWLIEKCANAGVSQVYDNRDQLAEFPKRPHFKEVGGAGKGFWPAGSFKK